MIDSRDTGVVTYFCAFLRTKDSGIIKIQPDLPGAVEISLKGQERVRLRSGVA